MIGRLPTRISRILCSTGIAVTLVATLAACGSSSTPTGNQGPIRIGVSLSLSGDFSADGQAFQQGYELWRDYVNANGGLLGRRVQLDEVSDGSDPQQVATNYQTLINVNHDDLIFGPFSTLLTKAADVVANRYGYAFVEGAGGGPSVFTQGLNNVFDVSLPVANNLVSFANYIAALSRDGVCRFMAVAGSGDGACQRRVGKKRDGDTGSRRQAERGKQQPQRLSAAAGPEFAAFTEQDDAVRGRRAVPNGVQRGHEIVHGVRKSEARDGVQTMGGHFFSGG